MQLTRTSEKLKRTILFNAERRESPFAALWARGIFPSSSSETEGGA